VPRNVRAARRGYLLWKDKELGFGRPEKEVLSIVDNFVKGNPEMGRSRKKYLAEQGYIVSAQGEIFIIFPRDSW